VPPIITKVIPRSHNKNPECCTVRTECSQKELTALIDILYVYTDGVCSVSVDILMAVCSVSVKIQVAHRSQQASRLFYETHEHRVDKLQSSLMSLQVVCSLH
jgi:hypothetical protein